MRTVKRLISVVLCAFLLLGMLFVPVSGKESQQHYYKKIETDAIGWTWNGFMPVENDQASRLWEHATFGADATGEYRFKGSAVELYGFKGKVGGTVKVEIDGKDMGSVSLTASKDSFQTKLAAYGDLTADWHTLKITSLEEGKWHAIDYIRVDMDKAVYLQNYNLAQVGEIICSIPASALIGGGNRDLNVIRNEKYYTPGISGAGPAQYDSYTGSKQRTPFYMGYSFAEAVTFSKLVFQEGDTWHDGGWFSNGEIGVQVLQGDQWKDVKLVTPVDYPVSDQRADFGPSCEIYTFDFEAIEGSAIRLYGMPGGTGNFVSVAQIEVYAEDCAKTLAEYDYRAATAFELTDPLPGTDEPITDEPAIPDDPHPDSSRPDSEDPSPDTSAPISEDSTVLWIVIGSAAAVIAAATVLVILKKKK